MNWIVITLAAFCAAVLGAMGMGGGGVLLIYLTLFAGVGQLQAQGINLIFFIPIACVALIVHAKNKLIRWRLALPAILTGLPGVLLGAWLARSFGDALLSKLFAALLLVIGIREMLAKEEPPQDSSDAVSERDP